MYTLIIKLSLFILIALVTATFLSKRYGTADLKQLKVAMASNETANVNNLTTIVRHLQEEADSTELPQQLSSAGGTNDGQPRALLDCYGHFSDAEPLDPNYEYYDCAVPYMLKTTDVGGLLNHEYHGCSPIVSVDGSEYIGGHPKGARYCGGIGYRGALCPNQVAGEANAQKVMDEKYKFQKYVIGDTEFIPNAIQFYFYPEWLVFDYSDGNNRFGHRKDADPTDENYYEWEMVRGELFDAILTNGTVIHCVATDANAKLDTNHALGDSADIQAKGYWPASPVKLPQYTCLFSLYQQTLMEVEGGGSDAEIAGFNQWLADLGVDSWDPDGVRVSYIRMYNKTIHDYVDDHGND